MHQNLQGATFHIEHIVPKSRGGDDLLDNLAWACPGCNLRKSDRIDAIDPESGAIVKLFHPRSQAWAEHFSWDDYHVVGLSATGRATMVALEFNAERRIRIRQAEQMFALYPPDQ